MRDHLCKFTARSVTIGLMETVLKNLKDTEKLARDLVKKIFVAQALQGQDLQKLTRHVEFLLPVHSFGEPLLDHVDHASSLIQRVRSLTTRINFFV